nr:nucleolar protein 3-like [Arachis hypogaea]
MAALAEVPWLDDDVRPPPPDADDREVTIPWGGWVHERPLARRRSRARAVVGTPSPSAPTAAPSSSTAAAPSSSTDPPAVPEPTYLLVQRLFRFMERERRHDHAEEAAEAPVQQDTHAATEPPETQEPQPVPQPEPEPIVVVAFR